MGKSIRYAGYILLFLIYIYSVKFTFFPLTGKVVMAVLGLGVWGIDMIREKVKASKSEISIFIVGLFLVAWGYVVMIINGSGQAIYTEYFLSLASAFFASYLLMKCTKRDVKTLDDLLLIIGLTVFFESLLTLGIRFIPSIQNLMFSLQEFQTREASDQDLLNINRFTGVGEAVYFGVLPSCAIGLVSLTSLIIKNNQRGKALMYWAMFFTITAVSFLVARYCLVMAALCFVWYMYNLFKTGHTTKMLIVTLIVIAAVYTIFLIFKMILPEGVFAWAFEMLDGGSSSTVEELNDWYSNTKFGFDTLLFGDGRYTNPDGSYYGGVDIGIYRQIFYAGIIGLTILVYLHYKILKASNHYLQIKQMKGLSWMLMLSFFIIMLKGDKSIFDLLMIFFVFARYSDIRLYSAYA